MQNSELNDCLFEDLNKFGLPVLPDHVVDSHRLPMDISGDRWRFNDPVSDATFNFQSQNIANIWLLYSLKRHLIFCIQRVSPRESWNTIRTNVFFLSKSAAWEELRRADTVERHAAALIKAMSQVLEGLRPANTLYNFARLRAWYRWCVDYLPDLGFDADEAYQWELVRVPGNEKGVAVRTEDPEGGPLNDAEVILLRQALQTDKSMHPEHVKQRAGLWLSLAYGRNPANFVQLRVGDFTRVPEAEPEEIWTLNIPRIKKRRRARTDFKNEYVDASLAKILKELIEFGHQGRGDHLTDRPLFTRSVPRAKLLNTAMHEWAWHLLAAEFTMLVQDAVLRYAIISPRTDGPMAITTRRLRYTFATNRVREGISAWDLAEALDHTDLQHVRVYFDAKSTVVERLDRAAAEKIAPKLHLFKGTIVKNSNEAVNGKDPTRRIRIVPELMTPDLHLADLGVCGKQEFCNLYPPYSCYPCDRFQPLSDSLDVHERVLEFLIERRERLRNDPLESSRIATQLDEVVYACAELVTRMKSGTTH